jgi:hypothetical protein
MTRPKRNDEPINLTKQELLRALTEDDALKELMQTLLQEVLEAQMDEALLAGKGERTAGRLGYRSGHYPRSLIIGRKLDLQGVGLGGGFGVFISARTVQEIDHGITHRGALVAGGEENIVADVALHRRAREHVVRDAGPRRAVGIVPDDFAAGFFLFCRCGIVGTEREGSPGDGRATSARGDTRFFMGNVTQWVTVCDTSFLEMKVTKWN